jgi:hypothetical protein
MKPLVDPGISTQKFIQVAVSDYVQDFEKQYEDWNNLLPSHDQKLDENEWRALKIQQAIEKNKDKEKSPEEIEEEETLRMYLENLKLTKRLQFKEDERKDRQTRFKINQSV